MRRGRLTKLAHLGLVPALVLTIIGATASIGVSPAAAKARVRTRSYSYTDTGFLGTGTLTIDLNRRHPDWGFTDSVHPNMSFPFGLWARVGKTIAFSSSLYGPGVLIGTISPSGVENGNGRSPGFVWTWSAARGTQQTIAAVHSSASVSAVGTYNYADNFGSSTLTVSPSGEWNSSGAGGVLDSGFWATTGKVIAFSDATGNTLSSNLWIGTLQKNGGIRGNAIEPVYEDGYVGVTTWTWSAVRAANGS